MSSYIGDLASMYATGSAGNALAGSNVKVATKSNDSLSMTDFLTLMVTQFQNQSIDNTMDTSDMLNQLVQMTVVTAINNITDATVMMYAGSLVGKEVTIGQYDSNGVLEELVGTVTGTGVSGGQQVIFVDGKSYYLSEIMAVGRLPKVEEADETGTDNNTEDPTDPIDPIDQDTQDPDEIIDDPVDPAEKTNTDDPEDPEYPAETTVE